MFIPHAGPWMESMIERTYLDNIPLLRNTRSIRFSITCLELHQKTACVTAQPPRFGIARAAFKIVMPLC